MKHRHPRRHVQPAARRPPHVCPGGARSARARPGRAHAGPPAAAQGDRATRAPRCASSCAGSRPRVTRFEVSRWRSRAGSVLHGRYSKGLHDPPGGPADLHRRGGHGSQPAHVAGARSRGLARHPGGGRARRIRREESSSARRARPRRAGELLRHAARRRLRFAGALASRGRPIRYLVPDAVGDDRAEGLYDERQRTRQRRPNPRGRGAIAGFAADKKASSPSSSTCAACSATPTTS